MIVEVIVVGSLAKKFHALQQASTRSSQVLTTVLASLPARKVGPDIFDGVQFRATGRQGQQGEVVGDNQGC